MSAARPFASRGPALARCSILGDGCEQHAGKSRFALQRQFRGRPSGAAPRPKRQPPIHAEGAVGGPSGAAWRKSRGEPPVGEIDGGAHPGGLSLFDALLHVGRGRRCGSPRGPSCPQPQRQEVEQFSTLRAPRPRNIAPPIELCRFPVKLSPRSECARPPGRRC